MVDGDFNVPVTHQDLVNSSMRYLNMPFAGFTGVPYGYNTTLLGNTQISRQLDHDKLEIKKDKENQDKNTAKNILIALSVILALGGIGPLRKSIARAGGFKKFVSNQWNAVVNFFKVKSTP